MTDCLALTNAFADSGMDRAQAEHIATAIFDAIHDNVATRADVQASEAAIRADLATSTAALRALLASEVARLDTRLERLDAKAERLAHRTFIRLGVVVATVAGLLFGALHAWPSHP